MLTYQQRLEQGKLTEEDKDRLRLEIGHDNWERVNAERIKRERRKSLKAHFVSGGRVNPR